MPGSDSLDNISEGSTFNNGSIVYQSSIIDEDSMTSNSASKVPTQQSTKAYIDNNLAHPKWAEGLGLRINTDTLYDAWLAKIQDQIENPDADNPLNIAVFGDSTSSITTPTFTGHLEWPLQLDILNSAADLAIGTGWRWAKTTSDYNAMTSTQGISESSTTANWGTLLTTGQYATQSTFSHYMAVIYSKRPSGGTIQIRDGSASGTILGTIDTAGTEKSGFLYEIELPVNFLGRYAGTLYFVASGGSVVIDGVHGRLNDSYVRIANMAHGGFLTNYYNANPSWGLDYVENNTPDVCVVMLGANDTLANIPTHLNTLIDNIQAVNPTGLILVIGMYKSPFKESMVDELSPLVAGIAESQGCLFVDLNAAYPQFGKTVALSGDQLHPSQSGHRAIASLIRSVLYGVPLDGAYAAAATAGSYAPTYSGDWPLNTMTVQQALDAVGTRRTQRAILPTSAIAETVPRWIGVGNLAALTSGTPFLNALYLNAGQVISSISWTSRSTALVSGNNQWFGLYDANRTLLAVTTDDGATAWAVNTTKTLSLTSAYTIPTSGIYYIGVMVNAATVPTLVGIAGASSILLGRTPIVCGSSSDTGLTSPPALSTVAGAITASTVGVPYAYIS